MAEPASDHIDFYARLQKVNRSGVSKKVRADVPSLGSAGIEMAA